MIIYIASILVQLTFIYADCRNLTYGPDCTLNCPCVKGQSESCYSKLAICNCMSNFTGRYCENDIDECYSGTHDCPAPNAKCENTYGGYNCICRNMINYYVSENGTCDLRGNLK